MYRKLKILLSGVLILSFSLLYSGVNCLTPMYGLAQNVVYAEGMETSLPKYMILMDDQFEGNAVLNEFIDWKMRKGNDVVVVKTSEIPSVSNGAPTNDEIVTYLRGLSDADYPKYLLVLGDETSDNGVNGMPAESNPKTYSDINLKSRNADDIPDVYFGRIPASNSSELSTMLSKILNMDRTPPSSDMYNKIVVAGGIQDSRDGERGMEDIVQFGELSDGIASYFESSPGGVSYNCTRALANTDGVTADTKWFDWEVLAPQLLIDESYHSILWDGATGDLAKIGSRVFDTLVTENEAKSRVINGINQGTAIINYFNHGEPDSWACPEFYGNEINAFQNGDNLPLVISTACLTGGYSYTENGVNKSFLKPWFTNPNGGAYAVVASPYTLMTPATSWFNHAIYMSFLPDYRSWHNNTTYPNFTSDIPYAYVEGIEEGTATRLGEMLHYAQMYTSSVLGPSFRLFGIQLFGDPEGHIRFMTPVAQNVTHDSRIFSGTSTVTIDAGEEGAEVCLYSEELEIHKKAVTGSDGLATFDVNVLEKGTINVTVTRANTYPYEGTISIRKYGDIDDDGVVSSMDMGMVNGHLLGLITLAGDEALAADVDASGAISGIDLGWIRKRLLGTNSIFPAEN